MKVDSTIPKRRLKAFRQFIAEESRHNQSLGKALNEEALYMSITGASAVVIDSSATDEERADAISNFALNISNMNAERILAIAVVCD
jgi:hypothetical protein